METEHKSIWVASLWMIVISLVLFFLPLLNGLIAGVVGGYLAGTWKRGLAAAVLPALIVAAGIWLLLIALSLPVVGLLAGTTVGVLVLFADAGLFVGAAVGGLIADSRVQRPNYAR